MNGMGKPSSDVVGDSSSCMSLEGSSILSAIPPNDPLPQQADALMVQEMSQLSFEERSRVTEDIHGVSDEIEETPKFVKEKLEELEKELNEIPAQNKKAYTMAKNSDSEYVTNPQRCLMFLRAELFDAGKAAMRMVKDYQVKLELFGPDLLGRDIQFDDLTPRDVDCLVFGSMQLLPCRDSSGRGIFLWVPQDNNHLENSNAPSPENRMRRAYYGAHKKLQESVELQRKGFTIIIWTLGFEKISTDRRRHAWSIASLASQYLPLRINSCHICYNNPIFQPLFALGYMAGNRFARLRVRLHYGSAQECVYALATFGIPQTQLPLRDSDGCLEFPRGFKDQWESYRLKERQKLRVEKVLNVGPHDVLFGKGKSLQDNPGNIRYRVIIGDFLEAYDKGDRSGKIQVVWKVLEAVRSNGGLFLESPSKGADYWTPVMTFSIVREKIAHSFRSARAAAAAREPTFQKPGGSLNSVAMDES